MPFDVGGAARRLLLLAILGPLAGLAGCARGGESYLEPLLEMDGSGGQETRDGDARILEIRRAIARYRREVERTVKASGQLEIYYKMLAVAYMQQGMFQPAYEALREAMAIQSANPILSYYAGLCAANLSKVQVESSDREQWLQRAEGHYGQALEQDPGYADALFALAVVYVFELERPREAVGLLERLLRGESRNMEARMLLGNAYYRSGRPEDALNAFGEVAEHSALAEQRDEAQAIVRRIQEELHGAP